MRKSSKYFFDFLVVFLAFWLNVRKEEQNKQEEQIQLYQAIYEDISSFYLSGRQENKKGFINLFQDTKDELDSLIKIKEIPTHRRIHGDYWCIEMINSLSEGEKLTTLDAKLFKGLANFNTSHQMFLDEIKSDQKFKNNR